MLDIKFIRDNKDLVAKGAKDKNFNVDLDTLIQTDDSLRSEKIKLEELQNRRNSISKQIGKAAPEEREALKAQVSAFKPEMEELTQKVRELESQVNELMLGVPAPAREDVPLVKTTKKMLKSKLGALFLNSALRSKTMWRSASSTIGWM